MPRNQSGFKPGDSCVNQLLAITHEIFSSFDDNYEVRKGYSFTFQKLSIKCGTRELFMKEGIIHRHLRKFIKPFNRLLKK